MVKQHCSTYYHLKNSTSRIVVNQGGSRSGKTYSTCELIVEWCYKNFNHGQVVTIARKTLPTCKGSVMRDFFEVLKKEGIYDERNHNKTENTYELYGNLIEFMGADESQKIRGRKRALLFLNEANEFSLEDFNQFNMRTTQKVIIDFNPSMLDSWIYDVVLARPDVELYVTTYKDNPFLEQAIIDEIENLANIDMNAYRVYALGERGVVDGIIFTNWEIADPDDPMFADDLMHAGGEYYGLDFGFTNDPSALTWHKDGYRGITPVRYIRELIYAKGLTNPDLADAFRALNIRRTAPIYADAAEPKSIVELNHRHFNVLKALKGPDSIRKGIDVMKQVRMIIHPDSANLIKELRHYQWDKDHDGKFIDEPIGIYNHAIDSSRYAQMTHKRRRLSLSASDEPSPREMIEAQRIANRELDRAAREDEARRRFWAKLNAE